MKKGDIIATSDTGAELKFDRNELGNLFIYEEGSEPIDVDTYLKFAVNETWQFTKNFIAAYQKLDKNKIA